MVGDGVSSCSRLGELKWEFTAVELRADGRATSGVDDPATGLLVAEAPEATSDDVDRAVRFAREVFDRGTWSSRTSEHERGKILMRAAAIVEREVTSLESLDCGKPIAEARFDIEDCAVVLEYYCGGLAGKVDGSLPPAGPDGLTLAVHEPVGFVAAIILWTYPMGLAIGKLAPDIAAGCVVILKPAEQTPAHRPGTPGHLRGGGSLRGCSAGSDRPCR